jgi:phage tail sheath gpL-like
MSGSISFNAVPGSIRVPGSYIEIDNSRAARGLSTWPARVVLIGQRRPGQGSVPGATPARVTSLQEARNFFGRGCILTHMFEAWFRANPPTEVWGVALADDAGGTAAAWTITFTGTTTAAGEIVLYVGGRRVVAAIPANTAQNAQATLLRNAILADPDLPVTSVAAANVLTLTANNNGAAMNSLDIRLNLRAGEALPAGSTAVIAPSVVGATSPSITPALDALGETWFTDIVTSLMDGANLIALQARLASNYGPLVMRDTHAWAALRGTFADLTTFGAAQNSPHMTVMASRAMPTPPWELAATLAAVAVPALATDPARPVQTLALPGIFAPLLADRFTWTERDQLLRVGLATWRANAAGEVSIERAITTYQFAPSGAADTSYLDVETLKTVAYLRWDLRQLIATRFPRHKLADDGTKFARGQDVVTPGTIRAEIIARFAQWEAAGLVEGVEQFKRDLIVTRNASDPNRVDALLPPDLVNQFRVLAAQIEFLL